MSSSFVRLEVYLLSFPLGTKRLYFGTKWLFDGTKWLMDGTKWLGTKWPWNEVTGYLSAVICVFLRWVWHLYNLPFVTVLFWLTFTVNALLTRILWRWARPAMWLELILITVIIFVLLRFPWETPKLNCNQTITVFGMNILKISFQFSTYTPKKKTLFVQKSWGITTSSKQTRSFYVRNRNQNVYSNSANAICLHVARVS